MVEMVSERVIPMAAEELNSFTRACILRNTRGMSKTESIGPAKKANPLLLPNARGENPNVYKRAFWGP